MSGRCQDLEPCTHDIQGVAVNFFITERPEPVSFVVPEISRALLKDKWQHYNSPRMRAEVRHVGGCSAISAQCLAAFLQYATEHAPRLPRLQREFERPHMSGHSQLSFAVAISKLFPSTSSMLTGPIPSCHRASHAAKWHDHVPRDLRDTCWSRVRSVLVLRFGFACGELEYAKSGVSVMGTMGSFEHLCVPLVLVSFCWPPCVKRLFHIRLRVCYNIIEFCLLPFFFFSC